MTKQEYLEIALAAINAVTGLQVADILRAGGYRPGGKGFGQMMATLGFETAIRPPARECDGRAAYRADRDCPTWQVAGRGDRIYIRVAPDSDLTTYQISRLAQEFQHQQNAAYCASRAHLDKRRQRPPGLKRRDELRKVMIQARMYLDAALARQATGIVVPELERLQADHAAAAADFAEILRSRGELP